jgi:hypothetical protein
MDQPTSDESLGEAARTEGVGTATCPQIPAGGVKRFTSGPSPLILSAIRAGLDGSTGSFRAD